MRLLLHTLVYFILLTGRRGRFLVEFLVIIICPAAETLLGGFLPQFLLCRIVATSGLGGHVLHRLGCNLLPPSAQELSGEFPGEDEPQQAWSWVRQQPKPPWH